MVWLAVLQKPRSHPKNHPCPFVHYQMSHSCHSQRHWQGRERFVAVSKVFELSRCDSGQRKDRAGLAAAAAEPAAVEIYFG